MYGENEEFEREMNYQSPSQVTGDAVAREFADGQEEEETKYVTVLDFDNGRVFQYEIHEEHIDSDDYELILSDYGHNLSNCQWMVHDEPGVTTENHREYIY